MGGKESLEQQLDRNKVNKPPVISIIIPVYNGEKFIGNCVESVLLQTYKEIQVIVIDDGSKDNTLNILKKYAEEDSRIEIIHKENGGVSKARNIGIDSSKGNWIIFIDADDYIKPDYCARMLEATNIYRSDVVIAKPYEGNKEDVTLMQEKDKLIKACLSFDESSYDFNIDAPWGKIFRAEIIKNNRIMFPENLKRSEDAYFCMSFYYYAKTIVNLNYFGYCHVERIGSICKSFCIDSTDILESIISTNNEWCMKHFDNKKDYAFALYYRVLPGISECENNYFLHLENKNSKWKNAVEYQKFLNKEKIKEAIFNLKTKEILNRKYKLRLLFYKMKLGWLFILLKKR